MEPSWQSWWEMARESELSAHLIKEEKCYRSCASRLYYAAYQAMTALLLYVNLATPDERQAWSHEATPQLLVQHLGSVIPIRDTRQEMSAKLQSLYKLRISSDYLADRVVDRFVIVKADRDCGRLMTIADKVLRSH